MTSARRALSSVLALVGGAVFLAWLVTAVLGHHETVSFEPVLRFTTGDATNLRAVMVLLGAGLLVSPDRQRVLERWERALGGRWRFVLPALVAAYAVGFKVAQHHAFGTGAYDLGLYWSAVRFMWGEGAPFAWSFGIGKNFFADHASVVLVAFVPLDIVFRSPLALLVVEGLVFGLGAFAVTGCARALGVSPLPAHLLGLASVVLKPVWNGLVFDFHPETFIPAACFGVVWALQERRWVALALVTAFALSIKEDVFLVLGPMVLLAWSDAPKRWHAPVATLAAGTVWMLLAITVVIPTAAGAQGNWGMFEARFGHWGPTPGAAAVAMVSNPTPVFAALSSDPVRFMLKQLAWLPLVDPVGLLAAAPSLAEQVLTRYEPQVALTHYYAIGPVTVWLLATVRVVRFVERRLGLVAAVIVAAAPVGFRPAVPPFPRVEPGMAEDRRLLERLPSGRTTALQSALVPHVQPSQLLRLFPDAQADVVVVRPDSNRWPLSDEAYEAEVRHLLEGGAFGVTARTSSLLVLERGADASGNAAALEVLRVPKPAPGP